MSKVKACGSCSKCDKLLIYIEWKDGKRRVAVGCDDCQTEMHFDLDTLLGYLGEDLNPVDAMLESFVPKGRPS